MSKTIVFVTGMHRSGTSALAGAFHKAGISMGDEFIKPGPDNPSGFYEDREALAINKKLMSDVGGSWQDPAPGICPKREDRDRIRGVLAKAEARSEVFGLKDPRFCFTLPVWARIARDRGINVKVVVVERSIASVVKSLIARNGGNAGQWKALRDKYRQMLVDMLRLGVFDAHFMSVRFSALVKDPRGTLEEILDRLEIPNEEISPEAGAEHINRDLINHGTLKRRR